jgi:hypothetical protein
MNGASMYEARAYIPEPHDTSITGRR